MSNPKSPKRSARKPSQLDQPYLDGVFKAAQECTGEEMPGHWEWKGNAHLEGTCRHGKTTHQAMSTTRKIEGFVNRQAAEQWEAYGNLSFGRQSRPMLHDAPSVIIIGSGDTAPRS